MTDEQERLRLQEENESLAHNVSALAQDLDQAKGDYALIAKELEVLREVREVRREMQQAQ